MHLWGSKKEEMPKKEGKPTEAELLKRHNCKTLELEDGTKFILVGGTHGVSLSMKDRRPNEWVHYARVKDFFDILEYDAICMEALIYKKDSYEVRYEFFRVFFNRIKSDERLYAELTGRMDDIYDRYPNVAYFFQHNPPRFWTKKELSDFQSSLRKISSQFKLSKYGREKLALFANEVMTTYTKWVQSQSTLLVQKDKYGLLDTPEKFLEIATFSLSLDLSNILLAKAVKQGKDVFLCDSFELSGRIAPNPWVTLYLGIILGVSLPFPFNVGSIYCLLYVWYVSVHPPSASERWLESDFSKYWSKLDFVFLPLIAYSERYREALTAFQLLSLADDFKARNKKTGTFIYWSHVGHIEGVLMNLNLGRENLKKKLNSKKFSFLKSLYRDYIPIEVSKLSLEQRKHFLSVARKYGVPTDKL